MTSPRLLSPLAAAWLITACDGWSQGQSAEVAAPALTSPARTLAVAAKFDSREIRTEAEPGAAVVELCYEFTNTGDFPLAVESFSQSCGCMRGSWNGVPVEPGARGSITARLLTRGLRGKVRKSPHVGFFESGDVELIGEVRTDSKDPRDALHGLFALVEKTGREGGRP